LGKSQSEKNWNTKTIRVDVEVYMTKSKQLSCKSLLMRRRAASIVPGLAIMLLAAVAATQSAHAQSFTTLATIGGNVGPAVSVQDAAGNLYGTTASGGSGFGTVSR
jgi:hypothetical protein